MILRLIVRTMIGYQYPVNMILSLMILYIVAGFCSGFWYIVYLMIRRKGILSNKRNVKIRLLNLIIVIIGWPSILIRLYDMLVYIIHFHVCAIYGREIKIMLEDNNIIRQECTVYKNGNMHYREYRDKSVELYEEIKDDRKEIDLKIDDIVMKDTVSIDTIITPYVLEYIKSISNSIPAFVKVMPQKKYSCNIGTKYFDIETEKDAYKLYLENANAIYLLNNKLESPYELEANLYNEFRVINDNLFIIDHSNEEVYTISNTGLQTLFGKFSVRLREDGKKLRLLNKYRWYETEFTVDYDDNFIVKSLTSSNNECYFLRVESDGEEFNERSIVVTYFVPFVHTSDGKFLSDESERIYCTKSATFDSKTNKLLEMENVYRIFSVEEEKSLKEAFYNTVKNVDF